MTFDFTCQACDTSFEVELSDLLEEPSVECPGCDVRAPRATVEAAIAALEELYAQLAALERKFTIVFEVDGGDIPSPWDREAARSLEEEDEEGPGTEDEWEDAADPEEEDR